MASSWSSTLCMGYALLITFLFIILKLMATLKVLSGFFTQTVGAEYRLIDGYIESAFSSFSSSNSIASTTAGDLMGTKLLTGVPSANFM